MKQYKIYVGGNFIETANKLNVVNPFTQSVFASTFYASEQELELAIQKGMDARVQLSNLSSYERYSLLMQIADEIKINKIYLAEVLSQESAKPMKYALAEIDRAAQTFIVAAEETKRLPKEYISLDWTAAGKGKEGLVKHFPIGLVAGIAPFNFPLNLAVHKIAPAIASACPIIVKPASSTPLSTLELAKIIDKTDLPKGALSILPMNRTVGNKLVTDERFKLLSFTGSPEVGWEMKKSAGKKKVVLELGGNAAVIVTPSANIELAVQKSVVGGFAYSGQVCIHAQRFYVHELVFEKFSVELIEATKKLKFGNPIDAATDISMMIDEENAKRVEEWVKEAVDKGAKVLLGGKREGGYVEPTIITSTSNEMKVCEEEIFGPVIVIEKYNTIEQAVKSVNDSKFGLQAGLFSDSIAEIDFVFSQLEVGGVVVNDVPTFRVDHMPYGGVKDSGLGREGVKYAMMDMLEPKILVK